MNKEPNKSKNEPNNEARVLSDEELEGIVGGATDSGPVSAAVVANEDGQWITKDPNGNDVVVKDNKIQKFSTMVPGW